MTGSTRVAAALTVMLAVIPTGAFLPSGVAHAQSVAAVVRPGDLASPGWQGLGGWSLYLFAMRQATSLALLPQSVAAAAIPLALFGWAAWRAPLGLRMTGLLCGYAAMLMLFARPDNFYWGLLMAPLLLAGLAFAPLSLMRLFRQALPSRAMAY